MCIGINVGDCGYAACARRAHRVAGGLARAVPGESLPGTGRGDHAKRGGWGWETQDTMADEQARRLRKRMTPQEVKLWVHLRSWRERGYHFRRQSPRQGYVLDFVCLKRKLVVEVDGGQHGYHAHAVRDRERDAVLHEREGFRVLRVWNNEIDRNLRGVLDTILAVLSEQPAPAPSPPPHPGDD